MKKYKSNLSNMVMAVILGGGAGTRLSPLTLFRSKPAVPICGKYRLVDIPISNCINSNINQIFVLTQYNSASLNKHIKNTYRFSMFSSGFVDILAAEQTPDNANWFQGTADAVRQSLKHFKDFEFQYFLILSGDQLYQIDFNQMLEKHIESQAEITIATIPVTEREANEFGILKTDEQNKITKFIEKPKHNLEQWVSDTGANMQTQGRNYLASMGIYVFNRETLLSLLKTEYPQDYDFGRDIIPKSLHNHVVYSYQYSGYWTDIGNIASFFEANISLTKQIPEFNLFDSDNLIYTRSRMLPPAKINGATIKSSIISEGSIIDAHSIENSVIGIRSRIGAGTVLKSTYVMGNDFYETIDDIEKNRRGDLLNKGIGKNCFIQNAIIDKEVHIGDNVTIIGGNHLPNHETELYSVKDGIVVVKKAAHIPNNFEIK
ncbi:MAG: glucose-1-phosphate adenylyltransferase [Limnohabitans sp.]|nr:glucose-1-phosphate adenylyltransferase [Limnohabitans sp.]